MVRIRLSPPPEGSVVQVPLGQSKVFVVSGSFQAPVDAEVTITIAVNGRNVSASIDQDNNTFQASVTLICPSQVSLIATIRSRNWVTTNGHDHWNIETATSNTVKIKVVDTSANPEYLIACRCVDSAGRPLIDLQIEAFDLDQRGITHKLGETAVTDIDGRAEFRFCRSDFMDLPDEGLHPDVGFRISDRGRSLSYQLPGEPNDHGIMHDFIPRPAPIVIFLEDERGYVVQGAIRGKYLSLGGHLGFLGRPVTDELPTPDGRGRFNHFEGGSIYWTPDWGAFEVHGLIRQRWEALHWEQGYLGFPVTDELPLPGTAGGRYSLFEHGIVTWLPGQSEAVDGPHHYERIYAQVRAHILSRFFAIGRKGRRNHFSMINELKGTVPLNPATPEEQRDADRARWRIVKSVGENPWLFGSLVHIALAVEHDEGNAESGRVLEAALSTLDSLLTWAEPGFETTARLPRRWDAGLPTDTKEESMQFLDGGNGSYAGSLRASDFHHYAKRAHDTLERLLGPTEAARYEKSQGDYSSRYRMSELSMDELTGLVTSCWVIGKLSRSATLTNTIRRQASLIGNYLADYGYIIVRPMGGVCWPGGMGVLPALEHPFSRALGSVTGADFRARTDFRGAMQHAGYWPLLEGPITRFQVAGWTVAAVSSLLFPSLAIHLGMGLAGLQLVVSQQVLSPSTIFGAWAVSQHSDCFDIAAPGEAALALIFREAPNKAGLYRTLTLEQADYAQMNCEGDRSWAVNFHSWIGLTGLDDADSTVRDTFQGWFERRQSHPEMETLNKMVGTSRCLFSSGVAALLSGDSASEQHLVVGLERAIVELFRTCYFDPQLPVRDIDGQPHEVACFAWWQHCDDTSTYSPLDFMVAAALAFWHAKRRNPVTTARFPQPLAAARFGQWPRIAVPTHCKDTLQEVGIPIEAIQGNSNPTAGPNGYDLFNENLPLVSRRQPPPPPVRQAATEQMCNIVVSVRPTDRGDVATGVTLHPGHEIQIDASGDIWAGVRLDGRNGPEGHPRLINDARWPLHTGIDPAANAFCLLGRLNGYFRIGARLPRTPWLYPKYKDGSDEEDETGTPLFLRINDDGPGDGNGQFDVRIQVWGPAGFDPLRVYRPPSLLRDGGILRTSEAADMIEVEVTPDAVNANEVQFKLITPDIIRWRKEIIIRDAPATGTGEWTIWTQDDRHEDANGLYLYQLAGATLTFRKMKLGGGVWQVRTLAGLEAAAPGSLITFKWVHD